MNLQSYIKNFDTKEVVTCVLLIVVGYMTAQLFMRKCNGFRVGGQNSCYFGNDMTCKIGTFAQKPGGGTPNPDPCSKIKASNCNKSWWQSKTDGGANGKTPIGAKCNLVKNECKTLRGLHSISGCPTKSCTDNSNSPPPGGKTPTPTPTPSPTVSCSSTGLMNFGDKCINNGSVVDDPSNDPNCKKLKDCHYSMFYKIPIYLIIFGSILFLIGIIYILS